MDMITKKAAETSLKFLDTIEKDNINEIEAIAVLKIAASAIENSLAAETFKQTMWNILNPGNNNAK